MSFLGLHQVAMLADQPGVGKTPQAVRAAQLVGVDLMDRMPRICVVTTKASIENWWREFSRWWPNCPRQHMFIINYDRLSYDCRELTTFNTGNWDIIIADEAHKLKSPGAKRTKNFYRTAIRRVKAGGRVWLLTGTPAKNHPGELFTHLRALRPDLILSRSGKPMSQHQFESRYCDVQETPFGRRINGARRDRIPELRKKLDSFMLRRLKKDVQEYLPDLVFDVFPLSVDEKVAQRVPDIPGIQDGMTEDEILDAIKREHMSTERRLLGTVKAPYVADYVESELEAPGKIIVFAHHRDALDILEKLLGQFKPARIDGRTKDAQAQVDMFQTDPDCRVMLGQISACGEALTMTAARQVAFAEAAWSPSDNYQAACRAHRHGLTHGLTVRFLSIPRTKDDLVQRVLARKAHDLAELFD